MSSITRSTQRRLLTLPLLPTIWEGDRLAMVDTQVASLSAQDYPTCVIWVDGQSRAVRAIQVADSTEGHEGMVRSLIQAMEHPVEGEQPGRPRKIVVRDRELHFFLRGVLQDLKIAVEYQAELPVVDLLFEGIREMLLGDEDDGPPVPMAYIEPIELVLNDIWQLAPWDYLQDHDVIEVKLQDLDLDVLYVSVLGNLGLEHGLLLYRSLASLRRFRQLALEHPNDIERMQAAFLDQDCLFVTYNPIDDEFDADFDDFDELGWDELTPELGSIHPLEGVRSMLDDDEAHTLCVALQALSQFWRQRELSLRERFTEFRDPIEITIQLPQGPQHHPVEVASRLDLSRELSRQENLNLRLGDLLDDYDSEDDDSEDGYLEGPIGGPMRFGDNLVSGGSLILLEHLAPEDYAEVTRGCGLGAEAYQPIGIGLPIIKIQTSKPKALEISRSIEAQGGATCISFFDCIQPRTGQLRGIFLSIQLGPGHNWQLLMDYSMGDGSQPVRDRWLKRVAENEGRCALLLYSGISGKHRGKPTNRELVTIYQTQFRSMTDLGLPPLPFG
jgi:hypothetical protein